MGFSYVPKVGKIYVVTLTLADTYYEVLTAAQARGIRGFKIKSRISYDSNGSPTHAPRPFNMALSETPDAGASAGSGFFSSSPSGQADTFGPVNGLWCSSDVAGTVLEIMVYE